MSDLVDHAARGRRVLELHRVADAPQAQAADDRKLIALEPDRAFHERHLDGGALRIRSLIGHGFMLTPSSAPQALCRATARSSPDPSAWPDRRRSHAPRCAGSPIRATWSGCW